jgi:hypothetical protein
MENKKMVTAPSIPKSILILVIVFISILIYFLFCTHGKSDDCDPNIVRVAYQKAAEMVRVDKSVFIYDENNANWEKELQLYSKHNHDENGVRTKLTNRNYQAVLFYPQKRGTLGGILWLFIDKQNYEVITFLLLK